MKYKIIGSNKINGAIKISGSKNASLPIIVASILTNEEVILENIPLISDVINMIRLLDSMGVTTKYEYNERKLIIKAKKVKTSVNSEYVKKIRASYYLIGALLSRKHQVKILMPGGCNFTSRPIDIHLQVFEQQGVTIVNGNSLTLKTKRLKPVNIDFPIVTVGGTINAILSSVYTNGITTLNNIAVEPEVIDVINFINRMGGDIKFCGQQSIIIKGVKKLHGTTYQVMPDRIEAGSYLLLGASIPNSQITITGVKVQELQNVTKVLEEMGAQLQASYDRITLYSPETLNPVKLQMGPYPAFPTDLQPIISAVLLGAKGTSELEDLVYPTRNTHVRELQKMNAKIRYEDGKIIIEESKLKPSIVKATDLRCGFALIIASNMAKGSTTINNAEYITRGYEDCIHKLDSLNVNCIKEL